jgi:hypothetical protein
MKSQFQEGALWRGEMENKLLPILEKYEVVLVEYTQGLLGSWLDSNSQRRAGPGSWVLRAKRLGWPQRAQRD